MPGEPLFAFTRFNAARQFRRSTASSIRPLVPERSSPRPAVAASTRAPAPAASPPAPNTRPGRPGFCGMAPRETKSSRPPHRSVLRRGKPRLLRPLLTSRPARLRQTSPFQAQGEISPGKNIGFRCATAGSTPPRLGHESFAVLCPLALLGAASYPVPVRRPAASLPTSFTPSSRPGALWFASLAVTSSREDFHLQVDAHAGRTKKKARRKAGP